MPADSQACVAFSVSRGVAAGRYTIALEDSATGGPFAAVSFAADLASLTVVNFALSGSGLEVAPPASGGCRVRVVGPSSNLSRVRPTQTRRPSPLPFCGAAPFFARLNV
jgi:hypothetical protein